LNEEGYIPFIYFIDAGLTSSLSLTNMVNFIDLFTALTRFDGSLVGQLMVNRSKNPNSVINPEEFHDSMRLFINTIKEKTFALQSLSISNILNFVFKSVRIHHVFFFLIAVET
jgi:aarF domain-containing kinase